MSIDQDNAPQLIKTPIEPTSTPDPTQSGLQKALQVKAYVITIWQKRMIMMG